MKVVFGIIWLISCLITVTYQTEIIRRKEGSKERDKRAPSDLLASFPLPEQIKQNFVDRHNELRRRVSPSASNMRMVSWDDKLSDLVKSHVDTCDWGHSSSAIRMTVFTNQGGAGQNLYRGKGFPKNVVNESTQGWFDEVQYYTYSTASCETNRECGHYTQLVWADTYKIGCAIANCNNLLGSGPALYVGCDYGPIGNRIIMNDASVQTALKPYISGSPCSNCSGGFSGCLDKLCVNASASATDPPTTSDTVTQTTAASVFPSTAGSTESSYTCDIKNCGSSVTVAHCVGTYSDYICVCNDNYHSVNGTNGKPRCIPDSSSGGKLQAWQIAFIVIACLIVAVAVAVVVIVKLNLCASIAKI